MTLFIKPVHETVNFTICKLYLNKSDFNRRARERKRPLRAENLLVAVVFMTLVYPFTQGCTEMALFGSVTADVSKHFLS